MSVCVHVCNHFFFGLCPNLRLEEGYHCKKGLTPAASPRDGWKMTHRKFDDLPIHPAVTFHSYVRSPEGNQYYVEYNVDVWII